MIYICGNSTNIKMCKKFCGKEKCKECFARSFASHYRAKWWSDRNNLKPYNILKYKGKYEFKCDCGHYFTSLLCHISKNNKPSWCPYCCNNSISLCNDENCRMCFNKSFASHHRAKWWSERNGINPRMAMLSSNNKYEFKCDCGHYFRSSLVHINRMESWCPYCCKPIKKLCDDDNCIMCFNNSFASHYRAKWWSEKNELKPRMVAKSSHKKYEFKCDCGHYFNSYLSSITKKDKPSWCPCCCTPPQKLCNINDCSMCFNNSFASHPKSKCWSDRNNLSPRHVFKGSHNKYEFKCGECSHYFKTSLAGVSGQRESWCHYCVNQKLCDNDGCKMCFNNSFASHPRSKYFSEKNIITPRQISRRSGIKYEFKCERGHFFKASPDNVSKQDEPRWCPFCKNKCEQKLYEWLVTLYPDVVYQYKTEWCRSPITNKYMPFDIFIPSLNIIIEVDGAQHFRQIANWGSYICTQSKDLYKMKLAFDKNITMIRVPYEFISKNIHFSICKLHIFDNLYKREHPEVILQINEDNDTRYDYIYNFDFLKEGTPKIIG